MIRIVSGPIDSGKTTRMQRRYAACRPNSAAGFISPKICAGDRFRGYQLCSLVDGRTAPLALLEEEYTDQFEAAFQFDRFIFAKAGFQLGASIIEDLLAAGFEGEIFIDEIGPLELSGHGFATALTRVLRAGNDLTISVRQSCLDEVLATFGIKEYLVLGQPGGLSHLLD